MEENMEWFSPALFSRNKITGQSINFSMNIKVFCSYFIKGKYEKVFTRNAIMLNVQVHQMFSPICFTIFSHKFFSL